MDYRRHLAPAFVDALNALYDAPQGAWWRALLSDPEVFVALRGDTINAYYRGCSLAEAYLNGHEVCARTHYKYLLRPASASAYIEAKGGHFEFPAAWQSDLKSIFISDLSEVAELKRAARPYAGEEKKLVGDVIARHGNVFDVEIALTPGSDSDTDKGRIDLAALRSTGSGVELVMYEAKLFSNKELRAANPEEVPVLEQVARYEKLLAEHNAAIRTSCLEAAANIIQLKGMPQARKDWADKLLAGSFSVSNTPGLIVGGFDADQKGGKAWEQHIGLLKDRLGSERLFAAGRGKNIRLPT
jgi:hypothetical protein